jgi:OOP family OmpA-OmpF porin
MEGDMIRKQHPALRKCLGALRLALVCVVSIPVIARADAVEPVADVPGSRDISWLARYPGSFIIDYGLQNYGELDLPLSALGRTDRTSSNNDVIYAPAHKAHFEGRRTRIVYLMPRNVSTLEMLRTYEQMVNQAGGSVQFECKGEACGGNIQGGTSVGAATTGLIQILYPPEDLKAPHFSNTACALEDDHSDQRYLAAHVDISGRSYHVGILLYSMAGGLYCEAFKNRTVAIIDQIERPALPQAIDVRMHKDGQNIRP